MVFAKPIKVRGGATYYLLNKFAKGKNNVVFWDSKLNSTISLGDFHLSYPRASDLNKQILVIADTFNHRVLGINIKSGSTLFSLNEYFPNDVDFLNSKEIIITSEHLNRVYKYNLDLKSKTLIFGCKHKIFKNLSVDISEVTKAEHNGILLKNPLLPDFSPSICVAENANDRTLYSPNGFTVDGDGTFWIADTDNHRVIHLNSSGKILRTIVGLNNPQSVVRYFE